jgi:hypothetical protein
MMRYPMMHKLALPHSMMLCPTMYQPFISNQVQTQININRIFCDRRVSPASVELGFLNGPPASVHVWSQPMYQAPAEFGFAVRYLKGADFLKKIVVVFPNSASLQHPTFKTGYLKVGTIMCYCINGESHITIFLKSCDDFTKVVQSIVKYEGNKANALTLEGDITN